MSKLKCPFCQQELFYTYQQDGIVPNPNKGKVDGVFCDNCKMYGNETIWERLDSTRKALDVALDAMDKGEAALIGCQEADDKYISDVTAEDGLELLSKAYKQITALEQKD